MTSTKQDTRNPSPNPFLPDTHIPLYAQTKPTSYSNLLPKSQISHEWREKALALQINIRRQQYTPCITSAKGTRRRSRPPANWKRNYWRAPAFLTREGTLNSPSREISLLELGPPNWDVRVRADGAENRGADFMEGS